MLDVKKLRSFYEARPFKPFEIVLVDGRKVLIDQPYFVGWMESRRSLSWASGEESFEFATFDEVRDLRPAKRRKTLRNGKKERRR